MHLTCVLDPEIHPRLSSRHLHDDNHQSRMYHVLITRVMCGQVVSGCLAGAVHVSNYNAGVLEQTQGELPLDLISQRFSSSRRGHEMRGLSILCISLCC